MNCLLQHLVQLLQMEQFKGNNFTAQISQRSIFNNYSNTTKMAKRFITIQQTKRSHMTKKTGLLATMLLSLVTLSAQPIIEQRQAIPFSSVRVNDNFWLPRLQRHKQTTLPMCIQQIERETGRIRNFENAAKELTNPAFNTEEAHERP